MTVATGDDFARELKPTVLVTGAAGRVGSAVAHRFADGGWTVVVSDVDAVGARRTGDAVEAAAVLPADLRDVAACRALAGEAVAAAGQLDCLVNAAGVWAEGPTADTSEADFDRVIDINLKGLFFVTAAAIPFLLESRGCIVNLSSDLALQGHAGTAVYGASKAAVSNLTRSLALELASQGVRVNALCPAGIDTPMLHDRADEVAELVWFLAQPSASPITGANLSVDFGLSGT